MTYIILLKRIEPKTSKKIFNLLFLINFSVTVRRENVTNIRKKVLRIIFGGINDNGNWRKRYNFELYKLFRDVDVLKLLN